MSQLKGPVSPTVQWLDDNKHRFDAMSRDEIIDECQRATGAALVTIKKQIIKKFGKGYKLDTTIPKREIKPDQYSIHDVPDNQGEAKHPGLTEKQQLVLETYMEMGGESKTAEVLGLGRGTVRCHLQAIEAKGLAPWQARGVAIPEHMKYKSTCIHIKDGNVVQEWRRLIPGVEELDQILDAIADRCKGAAGRVKHRAARKTDDEKMMLEVDIFDPHIGLLASTTEVGEEYHAEKAVKRIENAVQDIASQPNKLPENVTLVFGGDIMHSDNRSNQTPRSKHILDVSHRYPDLVDFTAFCAVDVVRELASLCRSLDIVVVPGNHDPESCKWLQVLLECVHWNSPNVNVITGGRRNATRFAKVWGKNLLAWAHGDGIAAQKWGGVISTEFAELWGQTQYRHLKLGHFHSKKQIAPVVIDEHTGLLVDYLESLAAPDAWHVQNGFVGSQRGASGFLYHKDYGMKTRYFHNPAEFE